MINAANDLTTLSEQWITAKNAEKAAQDARRIIEDRMLSLIGLPEAFDGTENAEAGHYKIKMIGRLNHKIDADRLQEIAAENGLTDHLGSLFRWKPEINARSWKAAQESITAPLLQAITTTPGRPSFAIIDKE
jgi:CRISPR/Cas system-associated endonuclease Cas1